MKYGGMDWDTMEEIIDKLCGIDGARLFLSDELVLSKARKSWLEKDGVIHLTLRSCDITAEQWPAHLEKKGYSVDESAKTLINSTHHLFDSTPAFKPTNNVIYKIQILKGELFEKGERHEMSIDCQGTQIRELDKPTAELALLIRDKITDADMNAMGLKRIVVMHHLLGKAYSTLLCVESEKVSTVKNSHEDYDLQDGFVYVESILET